VWYVLTTVTGTISSGRFPAPIEVWQAMKQIVVQGYADARLHEHVLHSVKLVLYGFARRLPRAFRSDSSWASAAAPKRW
jgi:NitT/TauT family transport system permease protein/taurine transport system permease protein